MTEGAQKSKAKNIAMIVGGLLIAFQAGRVTQSMIHSGYVQKQVKKFNYRMEHPKSRGLLSGMMSEGYSEYMEPYVTDMGDELSRQIMRSAWFPFHGLYDIVHKEKDKSDEDE